MKFFSIQQVKCAKKGLDPFLDAYCILRVGGRLKHGNFPFAAKHQVIIPATHHAVKLLVRYYLGFYRHVGQKNLLSYLREEYWLIGGRNLVKKVR